MHRLIVLIFLSISALSAETLTSPQDLDAWKSWVLDGKDVDSPYDWKGTLGSQHKVWSSRLVLNRKKSGMTFKQSGQVYHRDWVELPGENELWPTQVLVDGVSTAVVLRNGRPMIFLEKGAFIIEGVLPWNRVPSSVALPMHVGLIEVWSEGKRVENVHLDLSGRLWLKAQNQVKKGEADSLSVVVYRKIIDLEPMRMETLIQCSITGKEREVEMGPAQLNGFTLMELMSALPARLEKDGKLRVQLKSGQYTLTLVSRANENPESFKLEKGTEFWPKEEIWSIEEQRHLRSIEVMGGESINPRNHEMPSDWKGLPAYLVGSEDTIRLTEISRGDTEPKANRLTLRRDVWLDFDGGGATVKDSIQGRMYQGWRLNAQDDVLLGSAKVSEKPTLVTTLHDSRGIELRDSHVNVSTVSRMEKDIDDFFATGWKHPMEEASMSLHLPPAHDLLYVKGVDSARGSWFEKWSLLDVFIVLLISFALFRVLGFSWGLAAALYLMLAYHSPYAPRFLFFHFIVALALLKVLPAGGWWRQTTQAWAWMALFFLVLASLRYTGFQIREAIYPQLEINESGDLRVSEERYEAQTMTIFEEMEDAPPQRRSLKMAQMASKAYAPQREPQKLKRDLANLVQTGPGVPEWSGAKYKLSWNGPLSETEKIQLYLLKPMAWKTVRVLRTLLLALLIFGIVRQLVRLGRGKSVVPKIPAVALLFPMLFCMNVQLLEAGSYPSDSLLKELEQRSTRLPITATSPFGVSSSQGVIVDNELTLSFEVDVLNHCYLPINGRVGDWMPELVTVNGNVAEALRRDDQGVLQLVLNRGKHRLVLSGPVQGDFVTLPMPFPVHHFKLDAPGWLVTGLVNGRVPNGSLQLDKVEKVVQERQKKDALLPDPITPFVEIERHLSLNHEWILSTTVRRISPKGEPLHVQVPIFNGEKILTQHVQLKQDQVMVQLGRGAQSMSWKSRLEPLSELVFERGEMSPHQETWEVLASPLWRVDFEGLQPEKREDGRFVFHPRKGDVLRLSCSTPEAAPGALTTVDHVKLDVRAGQRMQRSDLKVHLNSSIAAKETLLLPTGSVLEKVEINGALFPLHMKGHALELPLSPGEQEVLVSWSTPQVLASWWTSPELSFSHPLNNITSMLNLPSDRWILACGGPVRGPALLFWGFLISTWLAFLCLPWVARHMDFDIPMGYGRWSLLLVGFCTVHPLINVLFVLWFFLMAWRKKVPELSVGAFQFRQLLCVLMTLVVLISMVGAIPFSLLGSPNMMIQGNGSYAHALKWFQDGTAGEVPMTWVFSVPLWVYRVSMLVWSLWLASSLVKWLKWAWECFSQEGMWRKSIDRKIVVRREKKAEYAELETAPPKDDVI